MANVLVSIEKGIEIAAEDAFKWLTKGQQVATSAGPTVISALGVLAQAVETALADASVAAANPAQLILTLPADIADFKTVWTDVKSFLATLGVKA